MTRAPKPPTEILRGSRHHEAFLAHNLATRDARAALVMFAHERRYYAELMPDFRGRAVLDLACGSGIHSQAWAEAGARVIGVDFDPSLLGLARRRLEDAGRPGGGWSCGDAVRLPLRSASFDLCYCNSLIEHTPDWRAVVAEAARVLKPGGVLVIYTTNRDCPMQAEVNHFPFYSWLPAAVKRRVMAWIMEHRRDLVNYTDFPAVNWFTFPGLKRELDRRGLDAYDRLDLIARRRDGPIPRLLRLAERFAPLKWPYRLYAVSIALYAVKRLDRPGSGVPNGPEKPPAAWENPHESAS
jgi:2-polyprenyl-6-hydroxyphenyl methylase/3-demethylubiquinone-9 3-methyltransferase